MHEGVAVEIASKRGNKNGMGRLGVGKSPTGFPGQVGAGLGMGKAP